jgi:hypothetical protein
MPARMGVESPRPPRVAGGIGREPIGELGGPALPVGGVLPDAGQEGQVRVGRAGWLGGESKNRGAERKNRCRYLQEPRHAIRKHKAHSQTTLA